jgi:hypothetical protein
MSELRDLRVPGLGLAPMKPLDDLYPRHYDPQIAAFLRSRRHESWPSALLGRLSTVARLGQQAYRAARRAPQAHPGRGFTLGQAAR